MQASAVQYQRNGTMRFLFDIVIWEILNKKCEAKEKCLSMISDQPVNFSYKIPSL